jgi:hypothetical protein
LKPHVQFDWERTLRELEIRLLKKSLAWPTALIKKLFSDRYKRVPHPKSSSENKGFLENESPESVTLQANIPRKAPSALM